MKFSALTVVLGTLSLTNAQYGVGRAKRFAISFLGAKERKLHKFKADNPRLVLQCGSGPAVKYHFKDLAAGDVATAPQGGKFLVPTKAAGQANTRVDAQAEKAAPAKAFDWDAAVGTVTCDGSKGERLKVTV